MSQIDHVTVVVRNIDQAISNYKAAGFSVHPSPDNATAAVAQAFVPFADYTFIRLIQFKSQPTAAPYTTLRARVENEGVADIAILARAGDLERLRTAAPGVTYSAVEDDPLIKVKRITVAGASPFPSFVADTGDRGARGVPFGPQFLVHANGAKGIRTALFSANDTAGCAAKLAALVGGKTESGRVRIGPADIKMIKAQKGEGPYGVDLIAASPSRLDPKTTNWLRIEFVTAAGWNPATGGGGTAPPPAPNVPGPAPPLGAYFFPSEDSFKMLVQLIDSAKLTIDAAVYAFSSNDLLYALDRARQRGVKLRMISEGDTVDNKGSDVNTVKSWGVEVKIRHAAPKLMHHKFAVVDNAYVSTGSFNWTAAARADNNENIVILNDPNIIKAFNAEFQKLWGSL